MGHEGRKTEPKTELWPEESNAMNEQIPPMCSAGDLNVPIEPLPQKSEHLARSTLDALSTHVAILDETGKIVAINRAWRSFATANQPVLVGMLEGANYLDLYRSADGAGADKSAAIIAGIQAIIRNERQEFVFESHCRSPEAKRWFNIRVTRFSGDKPVRIVVAHEDVTERKRAEESLRASESRYRTLFETSRDALMTLSPPQWRFTSGNPASIEMFGVRDEAHFVSQGPWQYSPKCQPDGCESAEKAKEMIETAMREGAHFFEWTHARIDGTPFPATVLLTRMQIGGETFLQATVRDITPQKRLEEERERAAEEIRDLYENAPCGYHSVDKDGVYVRVNNTELSWLGYSRDQFIGKRKFCEFMTPQSLEVYKNQLSILKEHDSIKNVECELVRTDGTTFPVILNATSVKDAFGNYLMSRCILMNVADRKQTEAALRESRETVRSHIENAFDVIFTLNRQCEFVFVSPGWELHLGHPNHKVVGKPFTTFLHAEDVDSCVDYLTRIQKTGQSETSPPYRVKHAKGDWRRVVANVRPHVDSKGETQFIGLAMLLPTGKKPAENH
jgi:PAS domain S-box-containing protein